MTSLEQMKIDAKFYDQIWSSADLNPDRITSDMSKIFTYNEQETKKNSYSDQFFNFNEAHAQSGGRSGGLSIGIFGLGSFGGSAGSSNSKSDSSSTTNHSVYSLSDIQRVLRQNSMEFVWTGEKFIPKSFHVYRLSDVTSKFQIAFSETQLIVDKENAALVLTVNIGNILMPMSEQTSTPRTGKIILYLKEIQNIDIRCLTNRAKTDFIMLTHLMKRLDKA